jgi:16S rRNA processing protein RimM
MASSSKSARDKVSRTAPGPGAQPAAGDLITIGRIVATHGLRGEVRVRPETDFPERFTSLRQAFLVRAGRVQAVEVTSCRQHPHGILLSLRGITAVDAAARLRGAEIAVPRKATRPLGADAYYVFELVGMQVRASDGRRLGELAEVMRGPANDVYVVRDAGREILIPALRDVVRAIDRTEGVMVVELPDGLEDLAGAR